MLAEIGVGVVWFGFGGTVGVIFENIKFCIFGIVGMVGGGVYQSLGS